MGPIGPYFKHSRDKKCLSPVDIFVEVCLDSAMVDSKLKSLILAQNERWRRG